MYPKADGTQSQGLSKWSSGLFSCTDDCGSCCLTLFCPCITFGRIAEIVDQGSTSCCADGAMCILVSLVTGWPWFCTCWYRTKLRNQYSLNETPCNDCLVHFCCEPCALCQEYRELQGRGFDMSIGWHANMQRQGRGGAVVPPVVQGGMNR